MTDHKVRELNKRISAGILEAQRRLFERKAKLGETVISADANGMPIEIPAAEALQRCLKRIAATTSTI